MIAGRGSRSRALLHGQKRATRRSGYVCVNPAYQVLKLLVAHRYFLNARGRGAWSARPGANRRVRLRRRGGISKTGNPRLRWLLVEAAWRLFRTTHPAAQPLRAWAERIAARRGRSIAAVALARRLAGILYAMWRDNSDYRVAPGGDATAA